MTPEQKAELLAELDARLSDGDVRIVSMRAAREVDPVDGWKRFEPGPTTYILIAFGPVQADREREVTQLLAEHHLP